MYLDGAHPVESMDVCGEWYSQEVEEREGEGEMKEEGQQQPVRVSGV